MSWLGLLLIGIGVADVVSSVLGRPRVAEAVGAALVVLVGLLAGLVAMLDLVALVVIAAVVVAWGESVVRGIDADRAWVPLSVLTGAVTAGVLASGLAGEVRGAVGGLLSSSDLALLSGPAPSEVLLVLGLGLVQLSTGNVLVRLVLGVTGTVDPVRTHPAAIVTLRGGRLLGPMERLVILGLGLAGELTAASIVVAAKGLLRWPEIQASRQEAFAPGMESSPGIHEVTEYFLVGSFVSWLVALGSLTLAGT